MAKKYVWMVTYLCCLLTPDVNLLICLFNVKHDILPAFNSALLSQQSTTLLQPPPLLP